MKRNFTLIEMLVVIAIIGILASMLSPALRRSMAAAHSVTCQNNLRQCGLMLMEYANGNHGIIAGGLSVNFAQISWAAQYFKTGDEAPDYIRCPLGPAAQSPLYTCYSAMPQLFCNSYGVGGTKYINHHGKPVIEGTTRNADGLRPWAVSTTRLRGAGTFMLLADSVDFKEDHKYYGNQFYNANPNGVGGLWFRHLRKVNLLFGDCHASGADNETFQEKTLTANGAFDRKTDGNVRNFITNGWLRTEDFTQHYVTY